MSNDPSESTDPTSDEEFRRALTQLVRAAAENGVAVEGGWACLTDRADRPDWDVEIFRVRKEQGREIPERK